jgi:glutathione S-transferase
MELAIGDKNLSSWSLRPWLVLKRTGAPFRERVIRLDRQDTAARIREVSPTGQVPALRTDDAMTVWDSLAISEFLAERFPDARLWPERADARALARAAACEMHAGFAPLRKEHPMNLKRRTLRAPSPEVAANLRRLATLWCELRERFGADGPWLCGTWSIADAFYTPVATRIRTYGLDLAAHGDYGAAQAYADTLLTQPDFLAWEADALADPEASE